MVALLYASIVVSAPLCSLCPGDGEGAIVQDGLVVVLKDKVFFFLLFYISTVDFFSSVFALPKSSDIKIIVQDTLYCGDAPSGFYLSVIFFTGGLLSVSLRHTGGRDTLIGEVIGNALVSPAVNVELENLTDNICFRWDNLKLFLLVGDVAIGSGADPLAFLLSSLDDRLHLFAGISDRHFVEEKLKLDFQPIIIIWEVDTIPDGDDAYTDVTKIL